MRSPCLPPQGAAGREAVCCRWLGSGAATRASARPASARASSWVALIGQAGLGTRPQLALGHFSVARGRPSCSAAPPNTHGVLAENRYRPGRAPKAAAASGQSAARHVVGSGRQQQCPPGFSSRPRDVSASSSHANIVYFPHRLPAKCRKCLASWTDTPVQPDVPPATCTAFATPTDQSTSSHPNLSTLHYLSATPNTKEW